MSTRLISTETIKDMFPVKNVSDEFISPAIQVAQDKQLQQIIGTELLNKLLYLIETEDITKPEYSNYKILIDSYITPVMLWCTLSEMVPIVTFKLRNAGTVSSLGEHIQTVTQTDADKL